jgi:hypothetical protein
LNRSRPGFESLFCGSHGGIDILNVSHRYPRRNLAGMRIDDITCSLADRVDAFSIDIKLVVGSDFDSPHLRFDCSLSADAIM